MHVKPWHGNPIVQISITSKMFGIYLKKHWFSKEINIKLYNLIRECWCNFFSGEWKAYLIQGLINFRNYRKHSAISGNPFSSRRVFWIRHIRKFANTTNIIPKSGSDELNIKYGILDFSILDSFKILLRDANAQGLIESCHEEFQQSSELKITLLNTNYNDQLIFSKSKKTGVFYFSIQISVIHFLFINLCIFFSFFHIVFHYIQGGYS